MNNEKSKIKNIPINTIGEILQDSFYFSLLLHIKRSIKDIEIKNYIVMFVKGLSIIFVYELSLFLEEYNLLEKNQYFKTNMKDRVYNERQWVHQCVVNSEKMNLKLDKMGIDFENLIYDMNIILNNSKLVDMNFETFNEDNDLNFWNSVFSILEDVSECIIKAISNETMSLEKQFKLFDSHAVDFYSRIANDISLERYAYSTHRLFSLATNLSEIDKIFILYRYRYRLVSSIEFIQKIFDGYNYDIEFENLFFIKFENYIRKIKALVIEIVGKDLMEMNSKYSNEVLENIKEAIIEKEFYSLNRKIRNNIHYLHTSSLTNKELEVIDRNQEKYLKIIRNSFQKNIFISIDNECVQMTNFLKECERLGLTDEEIKKDYERMYLSFLYTGKIE